MEQKIGHMPEKLDFITPTFMTLFELFLSSPMQQYHEREVVRQTHVSKGSANKMLTLLSSLGFLTKERKGKMVFYKLNVGDPVVRQFKVLLNVYGLKKLIDVLKQYSRRIILFGSCAQGTDVKESDIDLFILSAEKDSVRGKISGFNAEKARKITPIIVNANELVKLKKRDEALYENIDRGIVLWENEQV